MSPLTFFVVSTILKVTAVFCTAAIIALLARKASAAARHLIWTGAMVAALLVAVLPGIVPAWKLIPVEQKQSLVAEPVSQVSAPIVSAEVEPVAAPKSPSPAKQTNVQKPEPIAPVSTASIQQRPVESPKTVASASSLRIELVPALIAMWLLGAALVLGRYLLNTLSLKRALRQSDGLGSAYEQQRLRELSAKLGIERPVSLVESSDIEVPMTWGVVYPRVLLPQNAREWTSERLDAVLQHELAHVKRFDALTQWLSHFACALYWFHPLAWYAAKQMRNERERACDDFVLHSGVQPSRYANDLLEIVSSFKSEAEHYPAALAMARRSQFEGRLMALLNPQVKRSSISRFEMTLAGALMLAVTLPMAAVTIRDAEPVLASSATSAALAEPKAEPSNAKASPEVAKEATGESASALPEVTATEPRIVALNEQPLVAFTQAAAPSNWKVDSDILDGCDKKTDSNHTSISNNDGEVQKMTISWSSSNCELMLKAVGKFTYKPDFTGFQSISPGGYINVTADIRDQVTKLSVKNGDNGLEYRYFRNGNEEPVGPAAEQWIGRLMITLDRLSAAGIDVRFPNLIRQGGANAVLAEAELMATSHAKAKYLMRLVKDVPLESSELKRVFTTVKKMDSDYERARVLMAGAERYDLQDAGVREAFLDVTRSMSSDYEHARTLLAFLKKGSATPGQVQAILSSVPKFSSDYERSRVLMELAKTHKLDATSRGMYLTAVERFSSDYERGRTLGALIASQAADDQTALGIIESAKKMSSDYEMAKTLIALAGSRPIEGNVKAAYEQAVQKMSSDHERGRAYRALGAPKQAKML